ncbi:HYC_CC_PP family protein [Dyadobacter arcticus]|uniref:Uncharacterized protein n=1 Tax=Dyadobacter arcticus TaxID=1078754 RepID=A0ABX0URZ9_9BACT|nr:hypothetical protein [Dyadobacter arcticus]NIJ55766.1 hypothetical protein [Dyadobacter arcticus]
MKNNFHRSITIFMAFLVLLSSTGFALIEHECMMKGKLVKLLQEGKSASESSSCCAKSRELKEFKGIFLKKTDCCKESQKFEKLDVTSSGTQVNATLLKVFADIIPWSVKSYAFIQAEWILPSAKLISPDISFSSMLHGRSLRCFIQSFII